MIKCDAPACGLINYLDIDPQAQQYAAIDIWHAHIDALFSLHWTRVGDQHYCEAHSKPRALAN